MFALAQFQNKQLRISLRQIPHNLPKVPQPKNTGYEIFANLFPLPSSPPKFTFLRKPMAIKLLQV